MATSTKIIIGGCLILIIFGGVFFAVNRGSDTPTADIVNQPAGFPTAATRSVNSATVVEPSANVTPPLPAATGLPAFAYLQEGKISLRQGETDALVGKGVAADILFGFSPDGSQLLFGRNFGTPSEIPRYTLYQLTVASGQTTQLTNKQEDVSWAAYAPNDARVIYYTVNDNILWQLPPGGSRTALETTGDYYLQAVWSPDGSTIAYAQSEEPADGIITRVALLDVATGNKRTLTDYSILSYPLAWAPDGKSLYYVHTIDGEQGAISRLYRYDLATSSPALIVLPDDASPQKIAVFADGKLLLQTLEDGVYGDLYAAQADGSGTAALGVGDIQVSLQHGQQIVVMTPENGAVLMQSDGQLAGSIGQEYLDAYGQWTGVFRAVP